MMNHITTITTIPTSAVRRALGVVVRPRVLLGGFATTLDPDRRSSLL